MKRKIYAIIFSVFTVTVLTLIFPNLIDERNTTAVEANNSIENEIGDNNQAAVAQEGTSPSKDENSTGADETPEKSNDTQGKESIEEEKDTESVTTMKVINGILLVNKTYSLPPDYNPGEDTEATNQLHKMFQAAKEEIGKDMLSVSGFRSYEYQKGLYKRYVEKDGEEKASIYSAKPGQSEHQTGLAFDIGGVDKQHWAEDSFADTIEASWLKENAHKYGFILRYPKDKTHITGYKFEPWHYRYVGIQHATNIYESGLTLEEYLLGE